MVRDLVLFDTIMYDTVISCDVEKEQRSVLMLYLSRSERTKEDLSLLHNEDINEMLIFGDSIERTIALFPAFPPRRKILDEHRILSSSLGNSLQKMIMSSHTSPMNKMFRGLRVEAMRAKKFWNVVFVRYQVES